MGAELVAPIAMWGAIAGTVVLLAFLLSRRIRKGAAAEAERDMLKGVEDDRIDFEVDRANERESALDRWRRRRDELRGTSGDRGDDS